MAKYNHINYSKFQEFCQHLPDEKKEQFQALVMEGQLLARTALQASLDSADTAAHSLAMTVVMRQASRLHLSRFPREVQTAVADLPFEGLPPNSQIFKCGVAAITRRRVHN